MAHAPLYRFLIASGQTTFKKRRQISQGKVGAIDAAEPCQPFLIGRQLDVITIKIHPQHQLAPMPRARIGEMKYADVLSVMPADGEADHGFGSEVHGNRIELPIEVGGGRHLDATFDQSGNEIRSVRNASTAVSTKESRSEYRGRQATLAD